MSKEKINNETKKTVDLQIATLAPHDLNDNDGFYDQNKKSRACARTR